MRVSGCRGGRHISRFWGGAAAVVGLPDAAPSVLLLAADAFGMADFETGDVSRGARAWI